MAEQVLLKTMPHYRMDSKYAYSYKSARKVPGTYL